MMNAKFTTSALLLILIGVVALYIFDSTTENIHGWTPVYKHDDQGQVISGEKEELISAIRNGYAIRIGWGWTNDTLSIEHLSDPIWLSIINENEVTAHLDPQILPKTNWETSEISYSDSTLFNYEWRVALSTRGNFDAVWYDRKNNEVFRRLLQNHIMTWFVEYPENSDTRIGPLFSIER